MKNIHRIFEKSAEYEYEFAKVNTVALIWQLGMIQQLRHAKIVFFDPLTLHIILCHVYSREPSFVTSRSAQALPPHPSQ